MEKAKERYRHFFQKSKGVWGLGQFLDHAKDEGRAAFTVLVVLTEQFVRMMPERTSV